MSAMTGAESGATILARLDEADGPQALNLPGYRLHPLKAT